MYESGICGSVMRGTHRNGMNGIFYLVPSAQGTSKVKTKLCAGWAGLGFAEFLLLSNFWPILKSLIILQVSKAHRAMVERGQKLNEIEDQMENMSNEAKMYAQNAQALKNMYKNKKWYQL